MGFCILRLAITNYHRCRYRHTQENGARVLEAACFCLLSLARREPSAQGAIRAAVGRTRDPQGRGSGAHVFSRRGVRP